MRARLVRADATTEPVDLPASPADARAVIYSVIGCNTLEVVSVITSGPRGPGVDMWVSIDDLVTGDQVLNVAAAAIVAFLSRRQVRQPFTGAAVFTGGPARGRAAGPLTSDYDEIIAIIATIAATLRTATTRLSSRPSAEGAPA
jgi:hypothetical protein